MSYDLSMSDAIPEMSVRAYYGSYSFRERSFRLPSAQIQFTEEPTCVYYAGSSGYKVSWTTSFKPLKVEVGKVEVGYYDNDTFHAVYTEEKNTIPKMTYHLPMSDAVLQMYVRAYYGSYSYRERSFSLPSSQMQFTEGPTCVYYTGSSAFTVTWTTSFMPSKVEVGYYVNGTFYPVYTEENTTIKMTYHLPLSDAKTTMCVCAYYGMYSHRISTFSPPFSELKFTKEATCTLTKKNGKDFFLVSWATSFEPVKIKIGYYDSDNGYAFHSVFEETNGLSRVLSYEIPLEETTSQNMYVCAYYSESSSRDSMFTPPCGFTIQPTGGEVAPGGSLTTSWNTNFTPTRVTIVQRGGQAPDYTYAEVASLSGSAKSYTLSYAQLTTPLVAELNGVLVRAYYGSGEDDYITSTPIPYTLVTPPAITTPSGDLPRGEVGTPYSFQLEADGNEPITWSMSEYAATLPPGLSISSDGLISGTPTENGVFSFSVKAENAYGKSYCGLRIMVGGPPEITLTNLTAEKMAYTGVFWTQSLAACVTGSYVSWEFVSGGGILPPGIELRNGYLSGWPEEAGVYRFTLRASNYAGSTEKLFTIQVRDPVIQLSADPESVTFPALDEGYSYGSVAAGTTIRITNNGVQELIHLSAAIEGTNASAFDLVSVDGHDPNDENGHINLTQDLGHGAGYTNICVRRVSGLAAGAYTADLVLKQEDGTTIFAVPLSFTVNAIPDPPAAPLVFTVDSGGFVWNLHTYDGSGCAGGFGSSGRKVTVINESDRQFTVTVDLTGSDATHYGFYQDGTFYEPSYGNSASFQMTIPYRGRNSFEIYPYQIAQGTVAKATLRIWSTDDMVQLPLQATGEEPYVYSFEVTPVNPNLSSATVTEGYTRDETEVVFAVTNTGTADLRNLSCSAISMDNEELYTFEAQSTTLAVGETTLFTVSMAEGQSAGLYGGQIRFSAINANSETRYYYVKVNTALKPLTGKATLVGTGVHGSPLSVALEGAPTDAEPTFSWPVRGEHGGWTTVEQETFTPSHVGDEVYCTVTFEGYEGQLVTNSVTVCHDWYVVQRYREASCKQDGLIAYGCTVDGCTANKTETPPALGHLIVNVPEREATCETQGNAEYWTCLRCDECWLDAEGTQATTYDDVHSPADPDNHVINAAHFPDAAFRAFVAEHFDLDHSGALSKAERLAVTDMDCSELGIASLIGIEYFPNLDYLDCGYNRLHHLDLSGNPLLTELDCSCNEALTALDLSLLPQLKLLTCSGCVSLTTLDLSANPELTELDCSYNENLTALDLSRNGKLWYLDCSGNDLAELDLSPLPLLGYLMCNDNELTELDLNHPQLQYIDCYGNALTELDLSACPALTYVDCSYNGLEALTLGKQSLLKELYCHENSLTSLYLMGSPLVLDAVLTTEGDLNEGTMIYSKGTVEFYVDPDVILITGTYILSGFEAAGTGFSYWESLGRYWLNGEGRVQTPLWKDGIAPDFQALSSYGIGGPSLDEAGVQMLKAEPEVGGIYYVSYSFSTSTQGQGCVDFSELSTANCTLTVPGYEISCIRVTPGTTSGGYDNVRILFKLCRLLPIDEAHFPDPAFRAYVAENFDADGDGYLRDAECEAVTAIHVDAKGLTSLRGIEYFYALTELSAEGNAIESVDLSYNLALTNVSLAYCGLWSLDLTSLERLKVLDVSGNNLASLDVSDSIELTDLYCSENSLAALGVSALSKLVTLYCDNNEIESLDLSHNPALMRLGFDANPLTAIDLSRNTGLTEIGASSCSLTHLDVSMLPQLVRLDCYDNPLQTLKLGTLGNLERLACYETPEDLVLDISGCPLILDAYLNGTQTTTDIPGFLTFVTYKNGSHVLEIDPDQKILTQAYLPGDINGDKVVDGEDVTCLIRYLKYGGVKVVEAALDVNGDGLQDNRDVTRLIRFVNYREGVVH